MHPDFEGVHLRASSQSLWKASCWYRSNSGDPASISQVQKWEALALWRPAFRLRGFLPLFVQKFRSQPRYNVCGYYYSLWIQFFLPNPNTVHCVLNGFTATHVKATWLVPSYVAPNQVELTPGGDVVSRAQTLLCLLGVCSASSLIIWLMLTIVYQEQLNIQ